MPITSSLRDKFQKQNKSKTLLAILLFGILICFAQATQAQNPGLNSASTEKATQLKEADLKSFNKPYGYHLDPILNYIHANPGQRNKITTIVMSYRSKIEPLRISYREKSKTFLQSVTKGDSSDLIMTQQMQLGELYSNITSKYCLMSLELRRYLNPQQIVLYEEYKKQQGWHN